MSVDQRGEIRSGSIMFDDSEQPLSGANIKVIGIGGGGTNAVNRMIEAGIQGVQFLVANTDLQSLKAAQSSVKLQIGEKLTRGLGVGGDPEKGRQSALEDTEKIIEALEGSDMVFITAGLGGGTGTGAGPIIASLATELGALTVAVVTKPFRFEGRRRQRQAEQGLNELRECVDTVITIPNERLLNAVPKGTRFYESFKLVDDVLLQAVQGISDIITVPGLINVDFADVKAIMEGMGMALMGTGTATGDSRAIEATQRAISSPLLEEASIEGAKGLLVNVSGVTLLRDEHLQVPVRIYLETDPVLPQIEIAQGKQFTIDLLAAHTHHFTYGENFGAADCGVPIERFDYHPTRPPVVLVALSEINSMPAASSAATSFISETTLPRITPSLASIRWMVGSDRPERSAS